MRVRIGPRWVGDGEPCLVVAEVGSNHNGDLALAKRLVDAAAEAGADAVKFQCFRADRLYSRLAGTIDEERVGASIHAALAALEMPETWKEPLASRCAERGVIFLSTPFDEESADALDPFVPAFKIASYEVNHVPLLRHVAAKGKPVLLSTGGAYLEEVADAISVLRGGGCDEVIVLHCTAEYPAPEEALNLAAIRTMREALGVPVGLSDHSLDPVIPPAVAAAMGAPVIEKHLTLGRSLPGPDHAFAVEPEEFAATVRAVRAVERMLGTGEKRPQPAEERRRAFGRRAVFATRHIAAGERFSRENTGILRQGAFGRGLSPARWEAIIGTPSRRAVAAGHPVTEDDVARGALRGD